VIPYRERWHRSEGGVYTRAPRMMGMGMGVGFSSPPPWTPAALGAVVEARWESDAGITLTSGRVSGWNDLANAHHWAQEVAANRPVVEDAVFGTSMGMRFTAASGEFLSLAGAAAIAGVTAAHVFVIVKTTVDPTVALCDGIWRFGQDDISYYPFNGTGIIYDNFGTSVRKTSVDPPLSVASARCYEVVSTASEWTNRLDGAELYTTAVNSVAWAATQNLGGDSGAGVWFDGWIGALIICNAKLTGSDLTNMRGYLAGKYGVTFA
jgi:hypothetical protein